MYAIESFMDELAAAAGIDPVAFRLNHLNDPRGRGVIELVAKKSNWSSWKRPEGHGHGIASATPPVKISPAQRRVNASGIWWAFMRLRHAGGGVSELV